ncbi:tetratricopeptide repeat domain-containing protein [Trichoderma breve]|uniref:Tetratricopeptide repeat domain-containing protein n=1 Tax=Trichoderma breve TaxID=2034170 RepID=A0A9W9B8W6_9HYPO|nr:tetratricopeptide repeat domain-containing protein [Trichoderma breve]KAJ4855466.1 tetratricopeptide repeat domain-containing protein [Trichoderma breve]
MSSSRGLDDSAAGGNASDSDSDYEELQDDIAKFDQSVREFLHSHQERNDSPFPTRGVARGRGSRGARGPRKAAKPRGDITARLAKVNQAFLLGDYSRALDLVSEVIRINAETHQAWTALSSIFREQGEHARALSAMVYAAHLRPKDVTAWLDCASFALNIVSEDEASNLHTARLCYSAALRADPTNLAARLGKATVCHQQGHLAAAIAEYNIVLKHHPYDLEIVRKLAEACIDNKNTEAAVPSAIMAYRRYFDYEIENTPLHGSSAPWHDIGIYVELIASTGAYAEAIYELKALSRWLVGRVQEQYWDQWQADDCEWDENDERRSHVPHFHDSMFDPELYGSSLPLDFRARLAMYRLRLGEEEEAFRHLSWLDPDNPPSEIAKYGQPQRAIRYLELLRASTEEADATLLVQLGRCYLATGQQSTAEECFHAAIDADEYNIDARIELANMYEKAREDEEALILAAEAMALKEAQGQPPAAQPRAGPKQAKPKPAQTARILPRRYRAKRFANPDKRRQDERSRAIKLSRQYELVRGLKQQIKSGSNDLIPVWMESCKELVDDFRSLKRFYTWDKYLHFLGKKELLEQFANEETNTELSQMLERLKRSLAPQPDSLPGPAFDNHQGISFDDWLDLFLDYAIGLSLAHRREEAYQVCESARDSTVFQSAHHNFAIHMAWSVCAINTNDEEKCITVARHLMRDGGISDSSRMFALLSRLCQSPVSWYTSGPAQKFILRQIKAIDMSYEAATKNAGNNDLDQDATAAAKMNMDICLLMLYGHILFTSTSYTYAIGYFLRAWSLDHENAMVNLSLGLAYVHYGLKRQSTNRQYLLLQGQAFISHYVQSGGDEPQLQAERFYNVGRLFQLLGIGYLSLQYYTKALEANKLAGGKKLLKDIIFVNETISLLSTNHKSLAHELLVKNLKL